MKRFLFWLCLGVNIAAFAMDDCIVGPVREYSFYYCPVPVNDSTTNMDDVGNNSRMAMFLGTAMGTVAVTAGVFSAGLAMAKNRFKPACKAAIAGGAASLLFGAGMMLVYEIDPSRCNPNICGYPQRLLLSAAVGTAIIGTSVGNQMLRILRNA